MRCSAIITFYLVSRHSVSGDAMTRTGEANCGQHIPATNEACDACSIMVLCYAVCMLAKVDMHR